MPWPSAPNTTERTGALRMLVVQRVPGRPRRDFQRRANFSEWRQAVGRAGFDLGLGSLVRGDVVHPAGLRRLQSGASTGLAEGLVRGYRLAGQALGCATGY
jgi:hypothetical protein